MRKSGILPSCRSEQRLALDAGLCGGLIRGKGARLRIRHRLAPLPLAAPRGAACAAPPASPSPECGIEGIPAAEGPHRAARGSGRKRPPEGFLPALAAASYRRAPAAPEAALGEMVARGGGSQGLILSPDRRVPRPLPGRSAGPQPPGGDLERFQRSSRRPAAGRLPAGFSGGIVPPLALRPPRYGSVRPTVPSGRTAASRPKSSKSPRFSTIYNGRVAYCQAALYMVP